MPTSLDSEKESPPVMGTPEPKPPAPMPPVQPRKGAPLPRARQQSSSSSDSSSDASVDSRNVGAAGDALRDSTNNRKGDRKRSGDDEGSESANKKYQARTDFTAVVPMKPGTLSANLKEATKQHPPPAVTTITPSTGTTKTPQFRRSTTSVVPPSALQGLSFPEQQQVPDVFSDENNPQGRCQCETLASQCAFGCPTSTYLATYGWEYRALTREVESQEFCRMQLGDTEPVNDAPIDKTFVIKLRKLDASTKTWNLTNYMDRQQPDLTGAMRAILVDWVVELSDEYNLTPATLHLAITLIDKSLACSQSAGAGFVIYRDLLQCLGCACCWIASKIEEVSPPTIDDFVYISDNLYTSRQIQSMERDVCWALKFHLWHITPVQFAHEYLLASCTTETIQPSYQSIHPVLFHMVHYLLEISRLPYDLVAVKPSLIAAAAIFLARATLGFRDTSLPQSQDSNNGFWTQALQYYTGYSADDLKETVLLLLSYQHDAEASSLKCAYRKYSSKNLGSVSLKTVLNVEDLEFA